MAFSGRAIYDTGIFAGVAEDVSDVISMISPFETPVLDRIGDPTRPATNVLHQWGEDELNPNTIAASSTCINTTQTSTIEVHAGGSAVTGYMQLGSVMKVNATGEYVQVTAKSGNYVTLTRGFGGTTVATIAAGATTFFLVAAASLEGADVDTDISRPRTFLSNYTQIFKKDVIVSGTVEAVTQLGNVSSEMEYQRTQRIRESIRDLEKAVIQGKQTTATSLGGAALYRTMKGIWDFVATNAYSTGTLTESYLGNAIKAAWDQGATDLDLIIADANYKRIIDGWNSSRVQVVNSESRHRNIVTFLEGTFGVQEVILGRWMPANSALVISTERVQVLPLQGRSYTYSPVSRTGDAEKGFVLGEYTVQVENESGMAKLYGS